MPYIIASMFSGLTRREQRVLILLLFLITVGLAVHHYRDRRKTSVEFITSQRKETQRGNIREKEPVKGGFSARPPQSLKVNINTASVEELCNLHGIGPAKARAIVDYRKAHNGFHHVDELIKVRGIGEVTLGHLRENITLGENKTETISSASPSPSPVSQDFSDSAPRQSPRSTPVLPLNTKININKATREQLMTLSLVGEVKAKRIIEYRRAHGPFRSVKDIMKVKGIGEETYQRNRGRMTVGGVEKGM